MSLSSCDPCPSPTPESCIIHHLAKAGLILFRSHETVPQCEYADPPPEDHGTTVTSIGSPFRAPSPKRKDLPQAKKSQQGDPPAAASRRLGINHSPNSNVRI
jgi:hypothetical protein